MIGELKSRVVLMLDLNTVNSMRVASCGMSIELGSPLKWLLNWLL